MVIETRHRGACATAAALKRAARAEAVDTITQGEQQDKYRWPGAEKQAWSMAHILPGLQRMYKRRLGRVARRSKAAAATAVPAARVAVAV